MGLKPGQKLELWVDQAPRVVLCENWFNTVSTLGVDTLSIMVDQSTKSWDPGWSYAQLESLSAMATRHNIEIVLTVWPYPDPSWIKAAFPWLRRALQLIPIAGIEGDLEMNWKRNKVVGFGGKTVRGSSGVTVHRSALDIAGDAYVTELRNLCDEAGCRAEATTFTEHAENGANADVACHMDRLKVQAYSIETRPDRKIPYNHLYGPGRMQRFTLDRTWLVPGVERKSIEVACGLPAWSQRWDGHSVHDAMETALEAATEYDIVGIAYWSSKHLFKGTENAGAVLKFLQGIKKGQR